MKKAGTLLLIYALVGMVYLIMSVLQPFTNAMIAAANTSINATSYPATQGMLVGWPFWSYLVPASIALVATVMVLRSDK